MTRHRRMVIMGAATVLAAGLALLAWQHSPRNDDPVYQGRRLSEWMTAFKSVRIVSRDGSTKFDLNRQVSQRDARRALREAGTNAYPVLFRLLRATDSPLKTKLIDLTEKQHYWRPNFTTANDLQGEAAEGFSLLGSRAQSAVPELIKILDEDPSPEVRSTTAYILGWLWPAANAALPSLQKGAQSRDSSLANASSNALYNLSWQRKGSFRWNNAPEALAYSGALVEASASAPSAVVPTLLQWLKNPDFNPYWVKFRLEEADPDAYVQAVTDRVPAEIAAPILANPPDVAAFTSMEIHGPRFLAAGDWSDAANGSGAGIPGNLCRLRGRLLIYEGVHQTNRDGRWWANAEVCMELQDATDYMHGTPLAVYFDAQADLDFELRDDEGREVAPVASVSGSIRPGSWVILPIDGSMQLRADRVTMALHTQPDGMYLFPGHAGWHIAAGNTNAYYLSATFSEPADPRTNQLDYEPWIGKLELPPVKIQAP